MSHHLVNWAWQVKVGDQSAKLVLVRLADSANDDGVSWPSQARLSQECELSERSIRYKIAKLEALGLLETKQRRQGNRRDTNWYQLKRHPAAGSADSQAANDSSLKRHPIAADSSVEPSSTSVGAKSAPTDAAISTKGHPWVARFVDLSEEKHGSPPPRALIGRMAKQIKALEGEPPEALEAALQKLVEHGKPASTLPALVFEAKATQTRPKGRDKASAWIAEHGWPTGSRFSHGSHGGQYVQDPLGLDKPPYAVPWPKPSFDDIAQALREQEAA